MNYKELVELSERLNRTFTTQTTYTINSSDFVEYEKEFVAEFAIPGFKAPQVSVKTAGDRLNIEAEATKEQEAKGFSGFSFEFSFPASANLQSTSAELDHGILKVVVPKKADNGYKKISVKSI